MLKRTRKINCRKMAMSKDETLLLSAAGDVVSCRCRTSPYPNAPSSYSWQEECAVLCCEADCDDMSMQWQESAFCGRGGLLGGAEVAMPLAHDRLRGGGLFHEDPRVHRAQQAFRTQPIRESSSDEDSSIVPIRSFDYSHFADGGNDMLREEPAVLPIVPQPEGVIFFHGIPTFLNTFAGVKITQVSAHPLGAHVLLTSAAGLLYSYGLNDHGQLGIGIKTPLSSFHRGYIMTPTIVTPLVENGGKAIACAAGVSHSLVVVETEERRLVKSSSFEPSLSPERGDKLKSTESAVYHQIYGFGRNDSMKIGLVSPKISRLDDEMDAVLLPRRVALRCKVRSAKGGPPQGVFAVQASAEHSAALVRRASGDVELYTWGNAMYSALGLPHPSPGLETMPSKVPVNVVPVPSFVSCLSKTSNREAQATSLLLNDEGEHPVNVSLGRRCSLVLTSLGRCFSFGTSEDGMLGLGPKVTEAAHPSEIALPTDLRDEKLVSISAGASHCLAGTESGVVLAWGVKAPAGIPCSEESDFVQWVARPLTMPPSKTEEELKIAEVCAGFDSSVLVAENGRVYSCGRNSGRLGLGECQESLVEGPKPMFGGLRLWHEHTKRRPFLERRSKPQLKRGSTMT